MDTLTISVCKFSTFFLSLLLALYCRHSSTTLEYLTQTCTHKYSYRFLWMEKQKKEKITVAWSKAYHISAPRLTSNVSHVVHVFVYSNRTSANCVCACMVCACVCMWLKCYFRITFNSKHWSLLLLLRVLLALLPLPLLLLLFPYWAYKATTSIFPWYQHTSYWWH